MAARRVTQDHARPFCTVKAGTARGFCENLTTNLGNRPDGASRALSDKTARTKKEMRAYPSDPECFVQRTTSMKDWPVFNDKAGSIAQKGPGSRRPAGPDRSRRFRSTELLPVCRPLGRSALTPYAGVEIGRSLFVASGNARHSDSHPARVSTPKSSCGVRARQSELDSRNLVTVS